MGRKCGNLIGSFRHCANRELPFLDGIANDIFRFPDVPKQRAFPSPFPPFLFIPLQSKEKTAVTSTREEKQGKKGKRRVLITSQEP